MLENIFNAPCLFSVSNVCRTSTFARTRGTSCRSPRGAIARRRGCTTVLPARRRRDERLCYLPLVFKWHALVRSHALTPTALRTHAASHARRRVRHVRDSSPSKRGVGIFPTLRSRERRGHERWARVATQRMGGDSVRTRGARIHPSARARAMCKLNCLFVRANEKAVYTHRTHGEVWSLSPPRDQCILVLNVKYEQ